ncbi:hypothetical protein Cni_G05557 [Canna indica]|uniref:Glutaredoxin domain-containing protein n=1 Tax=Canna indica TaxID=4628 RepID=A0AAQ3Q5L5_9LILI|nr:hypothetical protein Cni_G05557 [Canna indica]
MGCTGSKQLRGSRGRSPGPYGRCQSLPVNYAAAATAHRWSRDGDHSVALTSCTLGSLVLDRDDLSSDDEVMTKNTGELQAAGASPAGIAKELGGARTWSEMIGRRIPRTPTITPPNEPEVINAWELMAGLEDTSPLFLPSTTAVNRSFSFHTSRNAHCSSPDSELSINSSSPKPQWMQLSPGDSVFSDFDPEILSSFRKALNDLSPQRQSVSSHQPPESDIDEEEEELEDKEVVVVEEDQKKPSHARTRAAEQANGHDVQVPKSLSTVRARINEFQQKIDARKTSSNANSAKVAPSYKCPPSGEGKVVFYFTSLRGIRKTYEDCWAVSMILKGYGVLIDDRDVSMHAGFKAELIDILGPGYGGNRLPRVFADGNYLGGADEVRQLHEVGRLGKLLECCEMVTQGKGGGGGGHAACKGCGDVRFVPCETCSGSCKVYVEEEEEDFGGFRRCPECNENGLVRCPLCC